MRPRRRLPGRLANPTEATVKSLKCVKERAGGHVDQVCHVIGQVRPPTETRRDQPSGRGKNTSETYIGK